MKQGRTFPGRRWAAALAAGLLWLSLTASAAGTADFISSPSEQGAPAFHHHLVRPGATTTFIIRVANIWTEPTDIKLNLIEPAQPRGAWSFAIASEQLNSLRPGEVREVMVTLGPGASVKTGEAVQVMVTAAAGNGATDKCTLYAETSGAPKIYFVSIDSLDPRYLNLNAAATGPGKDGDWLMPNLHRLMTQSTFYPNNKVHIISATDMNHFNILAGTMTGTSGIAMVGAFFFGFDEQGKPIIRSSTLIDHDIARYDGGKHVDSIYNVAKQANPGAYTAFVSGKNWVPELYRFPEFGIDRIIHGQKIPEYIRPSDPEASAGKSGIRHAAKAILLPGTYRRGPHQLGNPAGNPEPQDQREQFWLARATGSMPGNFPPDAWVMDAAIKEIENEDPDVLYTLLAAVDDAGHAYGSAFDLTEWDDKGTPALKDDVSKFDPRASRQGIINVVRESDVQVGRFLDLLAARGQLDQAIIVLESDHGMVTGYKRAVDAVGQVKKAARKWSPKKDYFLGSAASVGMIALRPGGNPAALVDLEAALENWQVKNPVTGASECPVYVYNLEELKTGVDKKTGQAWLLPREYYSEYYVEHRQPDDQVWADLFIMTKPNYKLSLTGFGLGNLGMSNLPFTLPRRGYFIGTHGSLETQTALLIVSVPGKPAAVNPAGVYASDIVPTLYRILGWPIPPSVDGKGLPGLDPQRK
jgi:arylsulfatase A-like enzyme